MKTALFIIVVVMLGSSVGLAQDITFPRQLTNQGSVLTMYQPQVQRWDDYQQLNCMLAFSLTPYQGKEVLGVLYVMASTDVNMENHQVTVYNIIITDSHFPSLSVADGDTMADLVLTFFTSDRSFFMSLEQIVACTPKQTPANTVTVNNDPPVIYVDTRPTILLQLQGAPVMAAASQSSGLQYAVNANYPLFFDKTSASYFLYDGLEWQKSLAPNGPWSFTSNLPSALVKLSKDANWTNLKGLIPAVTNPNVNLPQVYYSETLAEMILFDGDPRYQNIDGTALQYATNTDSEFFYYAPTRQYYFLTSDRWFSSLSLNGPWVYASANLPNDFSNIPISSPASVVLSSVPGTEQAKDAVMIAQIPTTVQLNATEAAKQVKVVYAGEPQFKPIDNTTMSYAINTNDKVIQVSDDQYYACVQGIWFLSTLPLGPWVTASTVPQVIYTIPPSSPVYNVTYVHQSIVGSIVMASFTAGYMGVYLATVGGVALLASGTGFYHPPFFYYPPMGYPVCYSYPMTYGAYAYHPYPYGGVTYGASYNHYTGTYARSATAYGPYGSATKAQAYNPYTGTYARGGSVSTPYGTTSAAQAFNPRTGASASTVQHSNPYGQWGSSTVSNGRGQSATASHSTTALGSTGSVRTSSGAGAVGASGANNSAMAGKTANGDMFASANGNVYKNTGDGWGDATRPQPGSNSFSGNGDGARQGNMDQSSSFGNGGSNDFNAQSMNQEAQNRQRGNTQTQQFGDRSSGGGFGGGFGGGGDRFGGGGGFGGGGRRR